MTLNLNVKIDLSTTEDRTLIKRALRALIADVLEDPELCYPDDPSYVLAIIEHVEVRVG